MQPPASSFPWASELDWTHWMLTPTMTSSISSSSSLPKLPWCLSSIRSNRNRIYYEENGIYWRKQASSASDPDGAREEVLVLTKTNFRLISMRHKNAFQGQDWLLFKWSQFSLVKNKAFWHISDFHSSAPIWGSKLHISIRLQSHFGVSLSL